LIKYFFIIHYAETRHSWEIQSLLAGKQQDLLFLGKIVFLEINRGMVYSFKKNGVRVRDETK
jgi:hypothetical protein